MSNPGHNVDTVDKDEFLRLLAAHVKITQQQEEVAAQKKAIRKRLRGCGVVMNDFDEWRKELEMDVADLRAKFGRKGQYSKHLGHQSQHAFDLAETFSADEQAKSFDIGVQCGIADYSTDDNPYQPSVPQHQSWMNGWTRGQEIKNAAPPPSSYLVKTEEPEPEVEQERLPSDPPATGDRKSVV